MEDVIPFFRPGPTHLFPRTILSGEAGRKIHRRSETLFDDLVDHVKLHDPKVLVLAGHETCGKHPGCDEAATAEAAQVLQELLGEQGFGIRVIAAFERQKWVDEWSVEKLPDCMQPNMAGQQDLAAD